MGNAAAILIGQLLGAGELDIPSLVAKAEAAHARAVIEIKTVAALRDSVRYLRERGLYR